MRVVNLYKEINAYIKKISIFCAQSRATVVTQASVACLPYNPFSQNPSNRLMPNLVERYFSTISPDCFCFQKFALLRFLRFFFSFSLTWDHRHWDIKLRKTSPLIRGKYLRYTGYFLLLSVQSHSRGHSVHIRFLTTVCLGNGWP